MRLNKVKVFCFRMDEKDKVHFNADIKILKWENIFEVFGLGIRTYLANDSVETLPKGRARYKKLEILHYILLAVLYTILSIVTYGLLKFYGWIDYSSEIYNNLTFRIEEPSKY